MSGKNSCKHCGSFDLEVDASLGNTICTNCGVVLEESAIISEVQFEENAHGGSSAIGQFVHSDAKGVPMTAFGPNTHGMQKESKEITMQKAKAEISRMAQQLRISTDLQNTAARLYKLALDKPMTKGRRSSLVCAACLYMACRVSCKPYFLIDFSDVLQVDPYILGHTLTALTVTLNITLPLIDPCAYVIRFAEKMNLGDKKNEVITTAMRVLRRMKTDFMQCGRRPSGLCGSALILAARLHNIRRKLKDIVDIVHIQEVTLKKRLMEFGDTPTSSLTTEEFFKIDLGEAQDPPSFKAARLKDKERLQKFTDVQYEMKMKKLQRLIERELEKKRTKGKRSLSVCSDEMASPAGNGEDTDKSKSLLADVMKSEIEDESEVVQAVVDSTIEAIDTVYTRLKENPDTLDDGSTEPKGIAPTLETMGIDSTVDNSDDCTDQNMDKTKKAVNDSVLLIDNNSLEDLDEDELDSYIVTEEQFKQKEEAWLKLNQVYLEEQKKKEEERQIREKEEGKPEKKRKRQRKQKSELAGTAGEAAEKVLREKKISNKLNYDVLKSLNMDDFVKSMNLENQFSKSGTEDAGKMSSSKTDPKSTAETYNRLEAVHDEEQMECDDDYDEADDIEEEENNDEGSGLSVSNILHGEYMEDEEYDEEY